MKMNKSTIDASKVALEVLETIRASNPALIADGMPAGWGMNKLREALQFQSDQLDSEVDTHNLINAIRAQGVVVSSWSAADLSFLDVDVSTEDLDDKQLDTVKTLILENCARSLEEILGQCGNEHLSVWWGQHKSEVLAKAQAPDAHRPRNPRP